MHKGRSVCALEEEETPSHDVLFIAAACDAAGGQQLQAEEAEFNHSTHNLNISFYFAILY